MKFIAVFAFVLHFTFSQKVSDSSTREFPSYDGWFNNRANPSWGANDSPLTRRLPPHYSDGVFHPSGRDRPNPREISNRVMSGNSTLSSFNGKTALFAWFSQHVFNEIVDVKRSGCPPEHFDIPVPRGDPIFDPEGTGRVKIPYERSRYDAGNSGYSPNHPRNQLNEVTSYLDGSSIYGNERLWSNQLRLFKTRCENRKKDSNLFASQNNPDDCRGELASRDDEGRFPVMNTIGLPFENQCDPRDFKLKSATRYYKPGVCSHVTAFYIKIQDLPSSFNLFTDIYRFLTLGGGNTLEILYKRASQWREAGLKDVELGFKIDQTPNKIEEVQIKFENKIEEIAPMILHPRTMRLGSRLGNEHPFLLTFGILWFRHHNWLARQLRDLNPDWSDEKVFNEARIRNIATYQNIVMHEWLPILLGDCTNSSTNCDVITKYEGYNPGQPVGVTNVFQSAAIRYADTLLPSGGFIRGHYDKEQGGCDFYEMDDDTAGDDEEFQQRHEGKPALRLANTFWNANEAVDEYGIDKLIMGMASQIGEREDHVITSDIREHYYGPRHFSRSDAVATAIQGGRDHGLPDYNTARAHLGMSRKQNFEEINKDLFETNNELLQNMKLVHSGSLDVVDILTGGLLETTDGNPGELFRHVLLEQFQRIRDGDRFWFENVDNGLFDSDEISSIHNVSIRDVILRTNPSMSASEDIQDQPFLWNKKSDTRLLCPQPFQLSPSDMEDSIPLRTYDYFSYSHVTYIAVFSALGGFVFVVIGAMYLIGDFTQYWRRRRDPANNRANRQMRDEIVSTSALEIFGDGKKHKVQIRLEGQKIGNVDRHVIVVISRDGRRRIDVIGHTEICLANNKGTRKMFVRTFNSTYDLILKFSTSHERALFFERLKAFLPSPSFTWGVSEVKEKELLRKSRTKFQRDSTLTKFFRTALAVSMNMERDDVENLPDSAKSMELISIKISKSEFAEFLKLKTDNLFLERMFDVADTDEDGLISFREFLNIIVLFTKGSDPDDKIKLMFDMYDLNKTGKISANEFKAMVKSMIEAVNSRIDLDNLDKDVEEMMTSSGCFCRDGLNFDDFKHMMAQYNSHISEATISFPGGENGKKKTKKNLTKFDRFHDSFRRQGRGNSIFQSDEILPVASDNVEYKVGKIEKFVIFFEKFVQYYGLCIFWLSLYCWITIGVFLNSFYAAASNKASGLGNMAGFAVPVARGAAGALMFNFSTILLTMCKNIITFLRDTFLHRYIPFDYAVEMHKIIAWMGIAFSAVHIIAHGVNFYSVSTQSPSDILCIFRDYWFPSDYNPTFIFWCMQTITGITGVILSLVLIIMYVFACDYARRVIYTWFHWTHFLGYILVYVFCVLHGDAMMVQKPTFYLYFVGPAVLYTFDKLYSLSRKRMQIPVVKAELLPSDVFHLEFKRPQQFDYKAGQWVRIACHNLSCNEYHPFTLTSAPHEDTLSLHIRAVGPWTRNMRNLYDPENLGTNNHYPKLYLDGPFGEGHQDWYKYDVSVLVGGGIGVTPFASILKDLINSQYKCGMNCKAVYFMWVTRDQKQYEWLTDIIQEVERGDKTGMFHGHVFITQFPQKFDLRTTMLYICENHFQKVAGKSLFTGLKAKTHFGRPNFRNFFDFLITQHQNVDKFGVFSCGPPPMTNDVDKTCSKLNKYEGATFAHHFENF